MNTLIKPLDDHHIDFLHDESRLSGSAETISFPLATSDVIEIVKALKKDEITVQGSRTGLAAAAVPNGGHIINFSKANKILGLRQDQNGDFYLRCQPGLLLSELNDVLINKNFNQDNWSPESKSVLSELHNSQRFFLPPDPTEKSATIGGMVACNASGARTLRYGATRPWVSALSIVLRNGERLDLHRNQHFAKNSVFMLKTNSHSIIEGLLPKYSLPPVKNAAGYAITENMDLIDLFIGSEGTLGIITEVEIQLAPAPSFITGLTTFWATEDQALNFVAKCRTSSAQPAALEFFGHHALDLLRNEKQHNPAFIALQELPDDYHTAVYVELHAQTEHEQHAMLETCANTIRECQGNVNHSWLALNSADMEQLRFFRHAVPEIVNMIIDQRRNDYPTLTKLGTDMAVPDAYLEAVMTLYRADLEKAKLEYVIFGHIGNNHVHVNIIPRNPIDYVRGKALYLKWAKQIVAWGGTVSAEHGIGKLKRQFFQIMYTPAEIADMQRLKRIFDPLNTLNVGNIFEGGIRS